MALAAVNEQPKQKAGLEIIVDRDKTMAEQWFEAYCKGSTGQEALAIAGYNCKNANSRNAMSCKLKKRFQDKMVSKARDTIDAAAPIAVSVLVDLAINSEQDSARITAAKSLAEMAGLNVIKTESINDNRTAKQMQEDLIASINNAELPVEIMQALTKAISTKKA